VSESASAVYAHRDQPAWGRAVVLEQRTTKVDYSFEDGQLRTFLNGDVRLVRVEVPAGETAALVAKLRGKHGKAGGKSDKKKASGEKKTRGPTFSTFQAQLHSFELQFPGGFAGEKFQKEERGNPDAKGKKGVKAAAVRKAQEAFSSTAFAASTDADLFEAARQLMLSTTIVHPQEGALALGQMKEEDRPAFVHAIRELLHGAGEYETKFDHFVESLHLTDTDGKPKRPTWPTVTLFAAAFDPTAHIAVKPTYFEHQARLLDVTLAYESLPSGAVYKQFLNVARATEAALKSAGQQPRDLMDVYSFIWSTHTAKAPPKAAAKPAAPKA